MAAQKKYKEKGLFQNFGEAFAKGDIATKLSFLVWGIGAFARGQFIKGILMTLVEAAGLAFIFVGGMPSLVKFNTLGTVKLETVFDPVTMKNIVNNYDNSFSILLMSVVTLVIIAGVLIGCIGSVVSAYQNQMLKANGKHVLNFKEEAATYLDQKFYVTLLALPVLGVLIFTVIPLFILIGVAFTNYDQVHMPPNALFTWVGLANFKTLFGNSLSVTFGYAFGKVLSWTLIWAFFATFTTYFGGIFLAMVLNDKKTKWPKMWRTLFMVTAAVPQFVTLLLVSNFFGDNGIMNTICANIGVTALLRNLGLVTGSFIPFLTHPVWAKVTIIVINIWIGVPYQMLIATGVLLNIPTEMLEASQIDGANPVQRFTRITMPYLLAVTGPSLVTGFVSNINNFNVIYLLTSTTYVTRDQALASSNAQEVDLLVTWLFRLTQDYYNYKMAAVIGIMVFIVCAIFTVICFGYINRKESAFA